MSRPASVSEPRRRARPSVLAVSRTAKTLMPGGFTPPGQMKRKGVPGRRLRRLGNGGKDVLKLDDALATVDDFVHAKLGL